MEDFLQMLENAIQSGLERKKQNVGKRSAFDQDWLRASDSIREKLVLAASCLKKHGINSNVDRPNGNVTLRANGRSLIFQKDRENLKVNVIIDDSPGESFDLDSLSVEIESRVVRFAEKAAETEAKSGKLVW